MKMRSILFGLLLASCVGDSTEPSAPEVGVRMVWLGGTETGIPADVSFLEVQRADENGVVDDGATALFTVSRLEDLDDDGRPELLQSQLPVNTTFELIIVARDAGETATHRGRTGPIMLLPGQRRYIPLYLYPIGETVSVAENTEEFGAFPTMTTLPSGRVLVAGGFKNTEATTCPAGLNAESVCYRGEATREAYIFDPATAQFFEVESGMLAARGGHTATLLPDGRVLIAGGAEAALLIFEAQETGEATRFDFRFVPLDAEGETGAHANFEIFDSRLGAEEVDLDSNGDPGRGLFVGGSGAADEPGPLNDARCLHAAALIPAFTGDAGLVDTQVLLVGGVSAPDTYEVYDDRRPGGPGVYSNVGATLPTPRDLPASIGLTGLANGMVFITGGAEAASLGDLADVWVPADGAPNGEILPASDIMGSQFAMNATAHGGAAYAVDRPAVALYDTDAENAGTGAFVLGWYGARCDAMDSPVFSDGMTPTSLCSQNSGGMSGYRVVGETLATTQRVASQARSFATATKLDNGRVALVGGITTLSFRGVANAEVIGRSGATGVGSFTSSQRIFHAAAPLFGKGILILGGLNPMPDEAVERPAATGAEVHYLR